MANVNLAGWLIILVIGIAVAVSTLTHKPQQYDSSKVKIFISVLTGLGIFITFFFYYNVVELQAQQQNFMIIESIEKLNQNIDDNYYDTMRDSVLIVPKFTASILPLSFTQEEYDSYIDQVGSQAILQKTILAHNIFILWRDYISYYYYIVKGRKDISSYITMFLQRANSQELFSIWKTSDSDFDSVTRKDID